MIGLSAEASPWRVFPSPAYLLLVDIWRSVCNRVHDGMDGVTRVTPSLATFEPETSHYWRGRERRKKRSFTGKPDSPVSHTQLTHWDISPHLSSHHILPTCFHRNVWAMSDRDLASKQSTDVHVSKDRQFEALFDSGYSTGTLSSTNIDTSSTSLPSTSSSFYKSSDCKATKSFPSTAITATDSGLCIDSDVNLSSISNATSSHDHHHIETSCDQLITWNPPAAFTPDQEGDT